MKAVRGPIVVVWILLLPVLGREADGEIYRWVDEAGVVHFQDAPPVEPGIAEGVERLPVPATRPQFQAAPGAPGGRAYEWPEPAAPVRRLRRSRPTVELYTSRGCLYCERARRFFQSRGIAYTEYDVGRDREAARRWRDSYGAGGVPLAVINGTAILGYNEPGYERALAEQSGR